MITERMIEEAAAAHAKEMWNHVEEQFAAMDGFKAGAQWAQQEFVKSLWHSVDEEPKKYQMVLLCDKKDSYLTVMSPLHSTRFVYEKWCYLSDLLPKKGGGE